MRLITNGKWANGQIANTLAGTGGPIENRNFLELLGNPDRQAFSFINSLFRAILWGRTASW
jgi:hypothetical protein